MTTEEGIAMIHLGQAETLMGLFALGAAVALGFAIMAWDFDRISRKGCDR